MVKTFRTGNLYKLLSLSLLTISLSVTNVYALNNPPVNVHNDVATHLKSNHHVIAPFTATYSIIHKSDPVGSGVRQLKYLSDNTAEYSYHSDIKWLIFSDQRQEHSIVQFDQLQPNKIIPTQYTYSREGTGRDKKYHWLFDINNHSAKDLTRKKDHTIDFPENIQDKLSYHLQHRLGLIANPEQKSFSYPVISTSGNIKNYNYEYDGEEELMLPYGLVKTVRFKREVTEKKRITYAWFAPELNYLLVKLYQMKSGVEQLEAQLTALETDQK